MSILPSSLALTSIADGSAAVAADHRNNFSDIQTALNDLLTILAAGAAGEVFSSSGGTSVAWSGAAFLAAPQKYGTLIDVVSSAAETDILQAAGYQIPGGTLGTLGAVRATIIGDYLNNTGGLASGRLRIYLGATTMFDSGAVNFAASANRQPVSSAMPAPEPRRLEG